jgi:hypothetical protein
MSLVLLPLELLLMWGWKAHPAELGWLADQDPTATLAHILAWVDFHAPLAAGLAAFWLLLQAVLVALAAAHSCCPGRRWQPR